MKSKTIPALIVGGLLALILGGGALAALHIRDHSIGFNKLTPGLQAMVKKSGKPGPQGPAGALGPTGAVGATGLQGPPGAENVTGYSTLLHGSETGRTVATVGPLSLLASCTEEGEDTLKGVLSVTTSTNLLVNNKPLSPGETLPIEELTWSGGGSEERLVIIRAAELRGSFALQGVASLVVAIPAGCRFWGSWVQDG